MFNIKIYVNVFPTLNTVIIKALKLFIALQSSRTVEAFLRGFSTENQKKNYEPILFSHWH
jgi:hypothetical protein